MAVTQGKKIPDPWKMDEEYEILYNGKVIGYWFVPFVLQHQYGEFIANDYGKELMGTNNYAGGSVWNVCQIIQRKIDAYG